MGVESKQWYAVYTRYKCEKSVQKSLAQQKIQAYVPLIKRLRQWGKNKRLVELPLISCYVFIKVDRTEFLPVLQTNNVVKFVQLSDKLQPIPQHEIDILRQVVDDMEADISVGHHKYDIGDMVEINHGPLCGLKGSLVEIEGKKDVVVELKNIGLSLRISVRKEYLRKIKAA